MVQLIEREKKKERKEKEKKKVKGVSIDLNIQKLKAWQYRLTMRAFWLSESCEKHPLTLCAEQLELSAHCWVERSNLQETAHHFQC